LCGAGKPNNPVQMMVDFPWLSPRHCTSHCGAIEDHLFRYPRRSKGSFGLARRLSKTFFFKLSSCRWTDTASTTPNALSIADSNFCSLFPHELHVRRRIHPSQARPAPRLPSRRGARGPLSPKAASFQPRPMKVMPFCAQSIYKIGIFARGHNRDGLHAAPEAYCERIIFINAKDKRQTGPYPAPIR